MTAMRSNSMTRTGLWLLLASVVLVCVDGPLFRIGVLPYGVANTLLMLAGALALVSFVVLIVGLFTGAPRALLPIVSIVLAGALTVAIGLMVKRGWGAPSINEVTTDVNDPPDFSEVVAARKASGATNPPEYVREVRDGEVAVIAGEAQRLAYPEIATARLKVKPDKAFEAADKAARAMGWEIVASVPSEGRIEATATDFYFGTKDDIAIRVRAERADSKVDVRSKSRIGASDHGSNAAHVRAYLAKLR